MKKALGYAFLLTMPVLFGYAFMGMAFGLIMSQAGFPFYWSLFISLLVYSGSMQFVLASLLVSGAGALSVIVATLSVQCRHIFYGLSLIDRFKALGRMYPYMIFSLTDETYSLLCTLRVPDGVDERLAAKCVAVLDHCYWVAGCTLGGLLGGLLTLDITGVDFAMTALFVVLFIDQWHAADSKLPAVIGLSCAFVSLAIFGMDDFLLPALTATVAVLFMLRSRIKMETTL